MRTSLAFLVATLFATSALAAADHQHMRGHLRQKRAWGQRRAVVSDSSDSSPGSPPAAAAVASDTVLTAVPNDAVGTVTISNTDAASPETTAAAVGATQVAVAPLTCAPIVMLGGSCDPNSGACCQSGLTCSGQVCTARCTIDTLEPYCDASLPCNEELGYTCYRSRCRPPTGAVRVQNEESCDQGSGNTRFCIPGRGICVGGTCLSCSQHA
ncbi:hypothetical protein JCM3770_006435 [Rhodotorula araucariae]